MFTFFTEVVRRGVVDRHGRWVGRPYDFTSRLDEAYPSLTALVIKQGHIRPTFFIIPWNQITQVNGGFQLKVRWDEIVPQEKYWLKSLSIRRHVLDQQVVDTFNRKVVRVNDVHLLKVDNELRIAHVDMGFRGLLRRLGWLRIVDRVIKIVAPHSSFMNREGFIAWKYIQPLSIAPSGNLRLNVSQDELRQIPPSDLSEMLMDIDPYQRAALFKTLDPKSQVDIITELELKWQKDLIESLDRKTTVELIENMPADEATDLLSVLSKRDAKIFLDMISPKKSRQIAELMKHESDSAGGLMTKEFITLREDMTIQRAIDHIRSLGPQAETIHYTFVLDEGSHLIGLVTFRKLLMGSSDEKIGDIMLKKPPAINIDDDLEEVATQLDKYNYFVMPVVDDEYVLKGIITIDDVLSMVMEEAWGKGMPGASWN